MVLVTRTLSVLVLVLVTFSFSHSSITPKWMRLYSS